MSEIEYVVHGDSSGKNFAVSFTAQRGAERLGKLMMVREGEDYRVKYVEVDSASQHRGVGTQLYTLAMRFACARGYSLVSDTSRSAKAEAFWEKQQRKGRAFCEGRGGSKIGAHNMRTIRGKWKCKQWRLSCAAPSLSGVRRRGKGSR